MKYEENEVRELLSNISPISPECKHTIKMTLDLSEVSDNGDVQEFRDRANAIITVGEFIETSVSNPFGALKTKVDKDGIKETKEDFGNLTITIKYHDYVQSEFEIKTVVADMLPLINKYGIKVSKINKSYDIVAGKVIDTEDGEFDDIADGTVK